LKEFERRRRDRGDGTAGVSEKGVVGGGGGPEKDRVSAENLNKGEGT